MLKSLSIHIDHQNSKPLYVQLHDEIIRLIAEEFFKPADRLPSIRRTSMELGINTVTVVNAFKLLEDEGYIELRKGSGTYVRSTGLKVINGGPGNLIDELYSSEEVELLKNGEISMDSDMINFASTTPSPEFYPLDDFKRVIIDTIENDGVEAFNYQESLGYRPLRDIICRQLGRYGVGSSAESVQIISGAQQGIDIVAKVLVKKGDCVIMENPTYLGAASVFKSRGSRIESAEMKDDGIDIDALLSLMKKYRPRIIYTMPTNQNPTGYTYSAEKRRMLLDIASSYGSYVIEDDFLSELYYMKDRPPLLRSLNNGENVILIKSYSKLLMPGLRIGFMIVPESIMPKITDAKHATDISTSGLIQRSFSRFLGCRMWESHLERIMAAYKKRFNVILKIFRYLEKYGIEFTAPCGGLNFWIRMPDKVDMHKLYTDACRNGVVFIPGSVFDMQTGIGRRHARFSFAQTNEVQIEKGLEILEYCLQKALNKKGERRIFPLV